MGMEERMQDMDALVDKLTAKEKKRRRNALLYLGLPILAGVVLIFWTGRQAEEIQGLGDSTTTLQVQLVQTREATKHILDGLVSYHGGNYTAAIRELDKAIKLDSLNPVVFELKGEMLLKKGDSEEAAKVFKKAVEIDSTQLKARQDLLLKYPALKGSLKPTQTPDKILKLKPDSQEVKKRKLKARQQKVTPKSKDSGE